MKRTIAAAILSTIVLLFCVRTEGQAPYATLVLDNQLIQAIKSGDYDEAKKILMQGARVSASDETNGCNALMTATMGGNAPIIGLLLDNGANVNEASGPQCDASMTPLIWAAGFQGNSQVVELLLDRGADFEAKSPDGTNALLAAAGSGNTEIVKMLLDHHANLEATDKEGSTALFLATVQGKIDTVRLLVQNGANVDAISHYFENPETPQIKDPESPLSMAAKLQIGEPQILNILQKVHNAPSMTNISQGPVSPPSQSAATAPAPGPAATVACAAPVNGLSVGGSIQFKNLAYLTNPDAEKKRIEGVFAKYDAQGVKWTGSDPALVTFSEVDVASIPQLLEELEYTNDNDTPSGKILTLEQLDLRCNLAGTYATGEIHAAVATTVTIKVAPGALVYYVSAPGQPEQLLKLGDDGTGIISIKPGSGQDAVYARYQFGTLMGYVRVDLGTGESSVMTDVEYATKTK
jgi:hypothetical protein